MKKLLKITGITVAALILALLLAPLIFRDRLKQEVKALANRTLESELNFSDMRVSFFSHFPHLALTLDDFSLMSAQPFGRDTLIRAREVSFGVDVMSLFGDRIIIDQVWLDRAQVNILYHESGRASFEVYKADTAATAPADTLPGTASLSVEKIAFSNCRILYSDPSLPVTVVAEGFYYAGQSSLTGDIFDLSSSMKIDSLDITYGGVKYIDAKPVKADLKTRVNTRNLVVELVKNDLKVKDIPLSFHGRLQFSGDAYEVSLNFLSVMEKEFMSARFKVRQAENLWLFARVNASIDLARWARALDVRSVDVKGLYELNFNAEGEYLTGPVASGPRGRVDTVILSIPNFDLQSSLKSGYLKFRELPQPVSNLGFRLTAACTDHDYRNITVGLEDLKSSFLGNGISGYCRLKGLEEPFIDADLEAGINLAEIGQVIPLDSLQLAGTLSADIRVNGVYSPARKQFPVTTALLSLRKGFLQTPYYPKPLEDMEMEAEAVSDDGTMTGLTVELKPFAFRFEGQPFTLRARMENFDDLLYDVTAKGTIDLGRLYKVFAVEGTGLDGLIDADLALQGRQSDAMAGRIDRLHNRGTLLLRDISVRSEYFPLPFIIRTGHFRFDRDKVWFDDFLATYGASDFRLKGSLQNTIAWALDQGRPLKGSFALTSRHIDVDEFMAFSGPAATDSTAAPAEAGVVIIPRNLDIGFTARAGTVSFMGLKIDTLAGGLNLEEGILALNKTTFGLIGCRVAMDATYGSIDARKAYFDFSIKADEFDVKRAYNEVAMVREMMPSAEKAEGIISLDYSLRGRLGADMMPVLPTLEGKGVVSVKKVKVYGLKLFNDIGRGTEKEGIKNPDLSKVEIRSEIKNNRVTLEQFKFKVKGIRVRIAGSSTFDNRLDLKIRLGLGPLGIIGIPIRVSGTADNPKIRYGRGDDPDAVQEGDYSDSLSPEMLQRIRNAKENEAEEDSE